MKTIWFLGLLLFVSACKKTRLEGDMSVLVGKWKWKYTITEDNTCVSYFGGPYLWADPSTVGYEYEMEFIEKGKLILKKDSKEKRYRIIHRPEAILAGSEKGFAFSVKPNHEGITVYYTVQSGIEYLMINNLPEGTRDDCEARVSMCRPMKKYRAPFIYLCWGGAFTKSK